MIAIPFFSPSSLSLMIALTVMIALPFALAMTGFIRRYALREAMLDHGGETRHAHTVPTPRGGGASVLLGLLLFLPILALLQAITWREVLALLPGALLVGGIGWLDDRMGLSARLRAFVHLLAAGMLVLFLLPVGVAAFFWTLAVAGAVNFYNFMDGLDGLAGSEAVFVGFAGAGILFFSGQASLATLSTLTALLTLGFLIWNWPPAKIFMGDVGSGLLGFIFGALTLLAALQDKTLLWVFLILLAVFLADSGLTLARRVWRGERFWQAHRSHAYQKLYQRWQAHKAVTLAVLAVNVFWLLPLALAAWRFPYFAPGLWLLAMVPLVAVWLYLDGGA